jgi:hypothetical protein
METTKMQSENEITEGRTTSNRAFGERTAAEADGHVVSIQFADAEDRKTQTEVLPLTESLEQLRNKFSACWLRGTEWLFEVGELLHKIKEKCEHGGWGVFLEEYAIARSTADDYIRRYKEEALQVTESRQFEEPHPAPAPDPESDKREEDIEEEQNKRKGKPRTHHQSQVRPTIKDLRPDQTTRYWEEYKEAPKRVNGLWYQAFLAIIRSQEIYPPQSTEDEQGELTGETVVLEEGQCSAS